MHRLTASRPAIAQRGSQGSPLSRLEWSTRKDAAWAGSRTVGRALTRSAGCQGLWRRADQGGRPDASVLVDGSSPAMSSKIMTQSVQTTVQTLVPIAPECLSLCAVGPFSSASGESCGKECSGPLMGRGSAVSLQCAMCDYAKNSQASSFRSQRPGL